MFRPLSSPPSPIPRPFTVYSPPSYCFGSTHSLIILVLLWQAGRKCLHSPKLSQFCLSSLFTFSLKDLTHCLGISYHGYVIAASSSVFQCDLSLVPFPRFHDASISVCLKINSPYFLKTTPMLIP